MVEFGKPAGRCVLAPHTPLKDFLFHEFAEPKTDSSVYVLQCSTALENMLPNSNFEKLTLSPWQNYGWRTQTMNTNFNVGPLRHLDKPWHGQYGMEDSFLIVTSDDNRGINLKMVYTESQLPSVVDKDYLDTFRPSGLLRFFAKSTYFDGTDIANTRSPGPHDFRFDVRVNDFHVENVLPEDSPIRFHHSIISDLSSIISKEVSIVVHNPAAKSANFGAFEILMNIPMDVGCYLANSPLPSTITSKSDLTPSSCLVHCKTTHSKPFALVTQGNMCYCADRQEYNALMATSSSKCEVSYCLGDEKQFCGGPDALSAFVTECPHGWERFGDSCYDFLPGENDVRTSADQCADKVNLPISLSR